MSTNKRTVRDIDVANLYEISQVPLVNPETYVLNAEMDWLTVPSLLSYVPYGVEIHSVAVNTNAGSDVGINYVYFVSGSTVITLPTAVGNESRYTIKNTGASSVTIATTGGQTIDGSASVVLSVANTSLDLVSDNANWRIV
jgi:hypothetical protein